MPAFSPGGWSVCVQDRVQTLPPQLEILLKLRLIGCVATVVRIFVYELDALAVGSGV